MVDRDLTRADIAGCMDLSRAAGWNQTMEDWRLVLETGRGRGAFVGGRSVASAAVMPYGGLGWICMVLVAPDARRRGHATRLMRWAMDALEANGMAAGLDATPEGREVYRRLGFRDVGGVTRWVSDGRRSEGAPSGCRPMTESDLAAARRFDAPAFGADRGAVLAALLSRRPDLAFVREGAAGIEGFVLGRDGDHATQIGPVVAADAAAASALLGAALASARGPVIVDLADRHGGVARLLAASGFTARRPFTRMIRGAEAFAIDARVFAVAGPEMG